MTVDLKDLGTAFRKAEVDLYYSSNPSFFATADYEEYLEDNLQRLQEKINGRSTTWVKDPDFLGTWMLATKAIKYAEQVGANLLHHSSPADKRPRSCRAKGQGRESESGNHDHCITDEIDVLALRQFQSCNRSPSEGFKPVPGGFTAGMPKDRKVLPKGEA